MRTLRWLSPAGIRRSVAAARRHRRHCPDEHLIARPSCTCESSAARPCPPATPDTVGADRAEPSMNIVIADPNPVLRRELQACLQQHVAGSSITHARSPHEAEQHAGNPACDLLVIDPYMPTPGQSDGIALLNRIVRARPDLQVIVLITRSYWRGIGAAFPKLKPCRVYKYSPPSHLCGVIDAIAAGPTQSTAPACQPPATELPMKEPAHAL
ncbi:response regulator [Stenotrophomonas sp. 24(2023)]|uniref:response regulator n=1 Tax=Stenotrophomonas sp. 24(2023) TaxID=3068324 RepID=UPI0027E1B469|nr:response regulator [Stenotrophomonas sp. 24(2023)]WMJ69897.1 response regulator [Stenotrophomonas sp. 24(2023)]